MPAQPSLPPDSDRNPRLYAGLDLSTQSLKLVALRGSDLTLAWTESVTFDADVGGFGTTNGALYSHDRRTVTAPTLMFVKAVDVLFDRLKSRGFPLASVAALSFSAQQHGTVFWSHTGTSLLPHLDASHPLATQLSDAGAFSIPAGPTWQDTSTTELCRDIETFVGGAPRLATLTGSRAHERFPGSQFGKIARENSVAYDATARVSLLSSFLASLFLQDVCGVDAAEGSGTNLMDLRERVWDEACLRWVVWPLVEQEQGRDEASAVEELKRKLGEVVKNGWKPVGEIGPYWRERYGFNVIPLLPPTGDNPSTLTSLPLPPGFAVLSLGTSDTLFLPLPYPPRSSALPTDAHVMCHPLQPARWAFAMMVYRNGSLARRAVRDKVLGGGGGGGGAEAGASATWRDWDDAVRAAPAGLEGHVGFYFPEHELIPPGARGAFRFDAVGVPVRALPDPRWDCRAALESRFMSMRVRVRDLLGDAAPLRGVVAAGGGAGSIAALEVASAVLGCPVYKCDADGEEDGGAGNEAAVGAAMRARFWGEVVHTLDGAGEEVDVVEAYAKMFEGTSRRLREVVPGPSAAVARVYEAIESRFREVEAGLEGKDVRWE
ncbi:actin-like ATPase domain-containing protein [Gonapodya prolifera JEL478]|uniref:Xylulose kinase n=1 Tax=Gonapodya prolifera (strain JEL478) TaxID=1344416 RepID=A0A138ZX40_GONPJ|nr:actin-like ATPase domain-containing protein [Gonapodya prolifera JEL478]|eukprot:KXS09011.1 actin-like ATPase domain-containing protein [Gonapodya prolifera JEL478]